jgi:hypothetical protein
MFREFMDHSGLLSWLMVTAVTCAAIGCGKNPDGFDGPRGEVQGTITFKGEPVPEGSAVLFQSVEAPTFVATGLVESEGKYQLKYAGKRQLPYKVQVMPPQTAQPQAPVDPDAEQLTPEAMVEAAEKAKAEGPPAPFPEKYFSIQTSKLTFAVEGGPNVADFELEE